MSEPILNWVNEDKKQTARLGQCTFTITQTKRGFRLRGKGKIPPDGGFDIDSHGAEEKVKAHAETLATAYVGVTDMPLTAAEWNAKYPQAMRVKVGMLPQEGRTLGAAYECEGVHLLGVQFFSNGRSGPIHIKHVVVLGPYE